MRDMHAEASGRTPEVDGSVVETSEEVPRDADGMACDGGLPIKAGAVPLKTEVSPDGTGVPAQRLFDAAMEMRAAGMNVVPVREDGSKTPELVRWRQYQKKRTDGGQIWSWFASDQATGIGCIYGAVSGNVELLEFEGAAVEEGVLDEVSDLMVNSGLADAWDAICTGWASQSPSGGMHFRFRVEGMPVKGNTKLASREAREDELTDDEHKLKAERPDKVIPRTLIETRGEGGFGVCEPSYGRVHSSGRPYVRIAGGPATMAVIDADTYKAVHQVCRMAHKVELPAAPEWRGRPPRELPAGQERPGDAFNAEGDIPGLISQHGWTFVYQRGVIQYWRRPGKSQGISASLNYGNNGKLYVFTSSTEFDNERAYSPFAVYAILEHGGNFKNAARDLGRQGYGSQIGRQAITSFHEALAIATSSSSDVGGTEGAEEAREEAPQGSAQMPRTGGDDREQGAGKGENITLLPSPKDPMAVVRMLQPHWRSTEHSEAPTLLHWQGIWLWWRGTHWEELTPDGMKARLYPMLEGASWLKTDAKGNVETVPWAPNRSKVSDLMEAMAAVHHLPPHYGMPSWLGKDAPSKSTTLIACENGLLDVTTRQLRPHTPQYLNRACVPFPYVDGTPAPEKWLAFLKQLWPDDPQAVAALQEWFGYVLSGRTDLQKMLFLVGPPRSGKGTIARVLTALVGQVNVAGPTLASLATNFGMAPLIKASLAVIDDARLPRRDTESVTERLLSVTGEGTVDVDRKNKDMWTGRIPARLMMLSNDLPPFSDASGAIATRMITLTLKKSFLGEEDTGLEEVLTQELSGIFAWALEGLDRLRERGKITEPVSSAAARSSMDAAVSPIKAFIEEHCTIDTADEMCRVPKDALWSAWVSWCAEMDRSPSNKINFGRMLVSAAPGMEETRPYINGQKIRMYRGIKLNSLTI